MSISADRTEKPCRGPRVADLIWTSIKKPRLLLRVLNKACEMWQQHGGLPISLAAVLGLFQSRARGHVFVAWVCSCCFHYPNMLACQADRGSSTELELITGGLRLALEYFGVNL